MSPTPIACRLIAVAVFVVLVGCSRGGEPLSAASGRGRYRVTLTADRDPVPINELHRWAIRVQRADGGPLRLRGLSIDGGMPAHGHGLPTAPTVAGRAEQFFAEGIRFNMAGRWELRVLLSDGEGKDQAVFSFDVGGAPAPRNRGSAWSDAELATLRSLWIGSLSGPPADSSNAVADNPRAAALGQRLFFDAGLSGNGRISCASCHEPARHFTDGRARARGLAELDRNAPSLVGVGFQRWFFWDGRRDSLWSQALSPIESPAEMGSTRLETLRHFTGALRDEYEAVFGPLPDLEGLPARASPAADPVAAHDWETIPAARQQAISGAFANVGKALAAYERNLRPAPAAFDRYVQAVLASDTGAAAAAMSPLAIEGLKLFISANAQCLRCHNGPLFTNGGFHNIGTEARPGERPGVGRWEGVAAALSTEFNCLGPYSDDRQRACPELKHLNRREESSRLRGAYKVPSLRNAARTAPYMHDGRYPSLAQAIAHYRTPIRSVDFRPIDLSPIDVQALVAFLQALSAPLDAFPDLLGPPTLAARRP